MSIALHLPLIATEVSFEHTETHGLTNEHFYRDDDINSFFMYVRHKTSDTVNVLLPM